MFLDRIMRRDDEREPLVYFDPMGQTNGSPVEDIPEDAGWPESAELSVNTVLNDSVNHPAHYTSGSIEVIDFIEDQKFPYHLGNACKYICRAGKKDPAKTVEDLRKAVWYINRYIQLIEKQGGHE